MLKILFRIVVFFAMFQYVGFIKPLDGWQAFFNILVLVNLFLILLILRNRKAKIYDGKNF
ncbi:hypothetical protein KJ934_00300 [Patescibacteria group bacterium]|nr:hypothetical protein [Patescibacteria group bacterium]MBU4353463.1 hypothetical protein [Patescibacteria group bacterium]MBU4477457.1 hypothetical protein [Patescibacteria group bacterium]MCG2699133.1 hypothetical protein [Candidatus Parcubacteria bacterium]